MSDSPTMEAPPSAPMQSAPNIVKADVNEPLPDLNKQLDDSLKAVFESNNPEPKHEEPIREETEHEEPIKSEAPTNPKKEIKPAPSDVNDPSQINEPKNLSKSSVNDWKNLKQVASKNFEIANQRMQELDTIKKSFANKEAEYKKKIETIEGQIKELSGYRAAVDIQADPEFISKYEQPMGKLQNELRTMLKSKNVAEEVINQIDFTDSSRVAGVVAAIEENSDKIFAKRFARRVEDMLELSDRKNEEIDSWQKNSSTFIEDRKKEALGKRAAEEGQMLKLVDDYSQQKNEDGTPRIPFLSKQEAPAGANKDQLKSIEAHNIFVDQTNQKLQRILKSDSPDQKVEIALAACAAQWLRWQLDDVSKKLQASQEELKRISSAGSEGDGKASTPRGESSRPTITDPKSLDLDNALQAHFGRR